MGGSIGKRKDKKGTPDAYIKLENGNFVFIEYTTEQGSEKKIFDKFKNDLEKCFDEKKTGIPKNKIDTVILCYNSKLSAEKRTQLDEFCLSHGSKLIHISIDNLAFDIYDKYPLIAKDYLGVDMDTGQILTVQDFLSKQNSHAVPLTNPFLFRETELAQVIEQLSISDLVVISGRAGSGKTKLALQAIREFCKSNPDYKDFIIVDKNQPLHSDLHTYLQQQNSVVLIDDANRCNQLNICLELLLPRTNGRTKIILTVRDYALNHLEKFVSHLKYSPITVGGFDRTQIAGILDSSYGINNSLWVERICNIAKGNPRLALMAAKVAIENNSFSDLWNVGIIYELFFKNLLNEVDALNDLKVLKTLGLLSYFRVLGIDFPICEDIYKVFEIDKHDFWESLVVLDKLELVDLYDNQVVKISDQIQSTFFFYKVVVDRKLISFSDLLSCFFYTKPKLMRDALYPVIDIFGYDKTSERLSSDIDVAWNNIKHSDSNTCLNFAETFWIFKQIEVISTLNRLIDSINPDICEEPIIYNMAASCSDRVLDILVQYKYTANVSLAIDTMLYYVSKQPQLMGQLIYCFMNRMGYTHDSHAYGYSVQLTLFESLLAKTDMFSFCREIILSIANHFLKCEQSDNLMEGRVVHFTRFSLVLTTEQEKLRSIILSFLSTSANSKEISMFLAQYISDMRYDTLGMKSKDKSRIIQFDAQFLVTYIRNNFDSANYRQCHLAHNYFKLLKLDTTYGVIISELKQKFNHPHYKMYCLLNIDRAETKLLRDECSNWEEVEKIKESMILKRFARFDTIQFEQLVDALEDILTCNIDHNEWSITRSFETILIGLVKDNQAMFECVLKYVQGTGNKIKLRGGFLITKYLACYPEKHRDLFVMLKEHDYACKEEWLLSFFEALPQEMTNRYYYYELISLLENRSYITILNFDFLNKFTSFDPSVYITVVRLLLGQTKKFPFNFDLLFNYLTDAGQRLRVLFKDDIELFEELYLYQLSIDRNEDYNGSVLRQILELDATFILKYLDWRFSSEKYVSNVSEERRYGFIWDMENYKEIVDSVFDYFSVRGNLWEDEFIEVFFENTATNEKAKKYIEDFIAEQYLDSRKMHLIFIPVVYHMTDKFPHFCSIFLKHNKNIEVFKNIYFEERGFSGNGSFIPAYEARRAFWKSILPILNTREFIYHKEFVSEHISYYGRRIEEERIRNFIDDCVW